jgi:gliding motility-associated-like protein
LLGYGYPRMKKYLILLLLVGVYFPLFAQSWLWGKEAVPKFGAWGDILGGDHSVAADNAGNVYFTGFFYDTISFGSFTVTSKRNSIDFGNIFLAKYDVNGNELWAKQSQQASSRCNGIGNSVALDHTGNAYVTGYFVDTISFGPFNLYGPLVPTYAYAGCVFLTKFDVNGNVVWAKQAIESSSSSFGQAYSVAVDNQGNAFIAGDYSDTLTFGAFMLKGGGVFLVKYDVNGNVLWARQSISTNTFYKGGSHSVGVDHSGNVYITGDFVDTISFNAITLHAKSRNSIFLVKYDANGNVLWAKQTVQPTDWSYGEGISISIDASNHIYQTGNIIDTLSFGPFTLKDSASQNVFLAKYDSNGNVMWVEQSKILDKNQWVSYSVVCDTLKEGGGFLTVAAPRDFSYTGIPPYKISFGIDTFDLNTQYKSATLILQFDSAGNVLCGNLFTEGDEDDGDAVGVDRSGQHIYVEGDLYDTTIFGSDTLIYMYDQPFIARWNNCPNSFQAYLNPTNINCNGQCNGQAKAIAFGGTGPYTFLWNNGSTNSIITGLCPGNYWVTVTDTFGIHDTLRVTITQPSALISTTSTLKNINCYGVNTGMATLSVSGGTKPYTYSWSPIVGTNATVSNLSAATYTCTITDKNGCVTYDTITITQPLALTSNISTSRDLHCNGDTNGSATTAVSGGTPPYTFGWSPSGGTNASANGLSAATYICFVDDNNGCGTSDTIKITQPPPVVVNVSAVKDTICFGSSINLNVTGANSYSWSPSIGLSCNNCANPIASPTVTTEYFVKGTDTAGCKDSALFTLNVIPKNFATISGGGIICAGSFIMLNAKGGGGYLWNTGSTTNSINISPYNTSTYSVVVTFSGCADTLFSQVIVTQYPSVNVCCDSNITYGQSVQLSASGTGPYIWAPSTGLNCDTCISFIASPLQTTTYTLTATNMGCVTQKTITIDVSCGEVFVPSAFSPNNDGQNDVLYVRGPCIKSLNFKLFDRWGNKIFESENLSNGWDGNYNGQPMTTGTYVYYLNATLLDGTTVAKKGNVALVR